MAASTLAHVLLSLLLLTPRPAAARIPRQRSHFRLTGPEGDAPGRNLLPEGGLRGFFTGATSGAHQGSPSSNGWTSGGLGRPPHMTRVGLGLSRQRAPTGSGPEPVSVAPGATEIQRLDASRVTGDVPKTQVSHSTRELSNSIHHATSIRASGKPSGTTRGLLSNLGTTACRQPPQIAVNKSARIVVVGGGPAGIHFATRLAKLGFQNILLLEGDDHLGGKSRTVVDPDGTPHELGTCYLSSLYNPLLKPLLAEYDPENQLISVDPILRRDSHWVTGETAGVNDSSTAQGINLPTWMGMVAAARASVEPRLGTLVLFSLALKYISVHEATLGRYPYGLPPRLTAKQWRKIDMPALDFLAKHGLLPLEGLLRWALQGQGYGVLEVIPAFFMLWWIHPHFVRLVIQDAILSQPQTTMLSKGYQHLWQRMAERHVENGSIQVQLTSRVVSVSRSDAGTNVTFVNTTSGSSVSISADLLVMAIDMSQFSGVVTDLSDEEEQQFSGYTRSFFQVSLYDSDLRDYIERPTLLWLYRQLPNETRDGNGVVGRVYALRNDQINLSPQRRIGPDGTNVYGNARGRQRRVAFQYIDGVAGVDALALNQTLLNDVALAGDHNVQLVTQVLWPYFPRFTVDALKKGNPWDIWERQGKHNTLWVGSSVSFESVLDVLTYNNQLLKRIVAA